MIMNMSIFLNLLDSKKILMRIVEMNYEGRLHLVCNMKKFLKKKCPVIVM